MIIAEAYLRIPPSLSDNERRDLATLAFSVAERGAQRFFSELDTPRVAELFVEDGSTKIRSRIRSSATGLLTLIGAYQTLRTALDFVRHDARVADEWMIEHIEPLLPVKPDVRRRRAPAATRLRRLFEAVESGALSADEATKRTEEILKEYRETPETVRIFSGAIRKEFQQTNVLRDVHFRLKEAPTSLPRLAQPTPIRAGRRLSVFRDPKTGQLVFVET